MINQNKLQEIGNSSIDAVENLLGKREDLKFNGFEFWGKPHPQLIGDHTLGYNIFVSYLAKSSEHEAIFQTSHEAVHLISPTLKENVSILEEGLAICFSLDQLRNKGYNSNADLNLVHLENNYPNYFRAYKLVSDVSDIYSKVKSWRESKLNHKISDLGELEIQAILACELTLASQLAEKFNPTTSM